MAAKPPTAGIRNPDRDDHRPGKQSLVGTVRRQRADQEDRPARSLDDKHIRQGFQSDRDQRRARQHDQNDLRRARQHAYPYGACTLLLRRELVVQREQPDRSYRDGRGTTTTFVYDAKGNLQQKTEPGGRVTTFAVNPTSGLPDTMTDAPRRSGATATTRSGTARASQHRRRWRTRRPTATTQAVGYEHSLAARQRERLWLHGAIHHVV